MRVALVAFHFAEYTLRLGKALTELGNNVLVLLKKENLRNEVGNFVKEFYNKNLKIITLPHRKTSDLLFLFNVFQICRVVFNFNPDIVHFQETLPDYVFLSFMLLRKKYPILLTVHDHIDHPGRDSQKRKRFLFYRKLMRQYADAIVVHGNKIKEEVLKLPEFKNKNVYVIPHGPLGFFPNKNKIDFKKFKKGRLLFFGRVEKYKGIRYLIEAHEILKQKRVPHKIVIAGKGSELDIYRNILEKNSYFEIKDYYIPPEEIPNLFLESHIVVLPYIDATQSGVLMMAMNYARPVIASSVGAISEVVVDGYNGLLVPPKDSYSLSLAIETLINDIDLSLKLGKNARNLVLNELSWNTIASLTKEIYNILIKN